jgi:hypothetical protein
MSEFSQAYIDALKENARRGFLTFKEIRTSGGGQRFQITPLTGSDRRTYNVGGKMSNDPFIQSGQTYNPNAIKYSDDYLKSLSESKQPTIPQQQQSSQPIRKAPPGYQLQGPPGKPYGFRNKSTGEWEWFATMEEMNAARAGGGIMPQVNPDYIEQNFSQLYRKRR